MKTSFTKVKDVFHTTERTEFKEVGGIALLNEIFSYLPMDEGEEFTDYLIDEYGVDPEGLDWSNGEVLEAIITNAGLEAIFDEFEDFFVEETLDDFSEQVIDKYNLDIEYQHQASNRSARQNTGGTTKVDKPSYDGIDQEIVFGYLDGLRLTGVTNMFGAGRFIEQEFGIDRRQSTAALKDWMETFAERHGQDR